MVNSSTVPVPPSACNSVQRVAPIGPTFEVSYADPTTHDQTLTLGIAQAARSLTYLVPAVPGRTLIRRTLV
jgi:hypothetical protein